PVAAEIALPVPFDVEPPDPPTPLHRLLPDAGVNSPPAPLDVAGEADVDGEQSGQRDSSSFTRLAPGAHRCQTVSRSDPPRRCKREPAHAPSERRAFGFPRPGSRPVAPWSRARPATSRFAPLGALRPGSSQKNLGVSGMHIVWAIYVHPGHT